MPVEPTLVVSDDSPSDSSDSEIDPDPVQQIVRVFETKPLIFKNAQFEGAVKTSKLPYLPYHLPEDLLPHDSPAISKSIIPYLAREPLIAPVDKSLPSPSLGPQYYDKPCSLALVQSIVAPATCFSISTSLLTDPPLRKDSPPTKGPWQSKRHPRFRHLLGFDILIDAVRIDAEQRWLRRRQTRFKIEENRYTMNDTSENSTNCVRGVHQPKLKGFQASEWPEEPFGNNKEQGFNHISLDHHYSRGQSNTDGIDITQSNNVIIENCTIGTDDDCIALGNAMSNVNITGVACGPGHGISKVETI
ncbi:putative polygalacturonase [Acorus calamus]|uniref:Polygalacturonase n=1 Tax=Acorus calamus TaxID=4465 RepID=A0AAV9CBC2_ACOCL|nr:putative polygalacturonase [Acorus calamus]